MRWLFMGVLCCTITAFAQNKQLLYGVNDLPQALHLNPGAAITFEKHLGFPFLNASIGAGSSGVSVYDIFQEGGDINARILTALNRLDRRDHFVVHQQLDLFSYGWKPRFKEHYFSFGVYQELDAILYFPKDLATLAYQGNAGSIGRSFGFDDLSAAAELLTVYHFGISKPISEKWRLGARFKLYSSIFNLSSISNKGQFVTLETPEGPNFYSHQVQNAALLANTSGVISVAEDGASPLGAAILSGNLGIGVDIGATYFYNDQWTATASLLDIGAIFHRTDLRNYALEGSYELEGIEFLFPPILDGAAATPYWENLEDEIEDQLPFQDKLEQTYTTWRPLKINAGISYGFGQNLNGECDCTNGGEQRYQSLAGLQFFSVNRPQGLHSALTAFYDRSWNEVFRSKLTYTIDPYSHRNIGLLISAQFNKFNVYIAADNLLEYPNLAKAYAASLQFGFQLIFDTNQYNR
ncbi:MAG: DUF5723 family protein [Dokdonia sp.]|nr:hypothetical protein [Cytophagaceae bacterium]